MQPAYNLWYLTTDPNGQPAWASYRDDGFLIVPAADINGLLFALDELDSNGWEVVAVGNLGGGNEHEILVKRK